MFWGIWERRKGFWGDPAGGLVGPSDCITAFDRSTYKTNKGKGRGVFPPYIFERGRDGRGFGGDGVQDSDATGSSSKTVR